MWLVELTMAVLMVRELGAYQHSVGRISEPVCPHYDGTGYASLQPGLINRINVAYHQ
jgi:hypothetical protein